MHHICHSLLPLLLWGNFRKPIIISETKIKSMCISNAYLRKKVEIYLQWYYLFEHMKHFNKMEPNQPLWLANEFHSLKLEINLHFHTIVTLCINQILKCLLLFIVKFVHFCVNIKFIRFSERKITIENFHRLAPIKRSHRYRKCCFIFNGVYDLD